MTPINKQKFLAELGRLLTFMYEEDRVRALREYEDIFEQAGNENAVMQLLVSPTRQAVNLARAYDSKDRRTGADGGEAAYLTVIDDLRRQAGTLIPAVHVEEADDDDQLSLFDKPDVAETIFDHLELDSLPGDEEDEYPDTPSEGFGRYPDEDRSVVSPPPPAPPERSAAVEEEGNRELDEFSDAVEAFLADFTIRSDGTSSVEPIFETQRSEQDAEPEPLPVPEPVPAAERHDEDRPAPAELKLPAQPGHRDIKVILPDLPDEPAQAEKKANVALLILYILIAFPITLLLVCLLLLPAALCLALAGTGLGLGFAGLIEAFTAFSVFADMLLVFGLALALAAFGLLFFWLFVWFLAGAIPGLIRGVCSLARRLCYREVTV